MTGETNIKKLLGSMEPELVDEEYVFISLDPNDLPDLPSAPITQFQEAEGLTLVIPRHEAEDAELEYEFPSKMITLTIHSSLGAVGFLSVILTRLAEAGISVNTFSAYYHDHLFVPTDRAEEALKILQRLSVENR